MTGCLFALLAALLSGLGARDQLLVAQLGERLGRRPMLLLVALGSGALASALAGLASREAAEGLSHALCLTLAALALGVGGLELLLVGKLRTFIEYTPGWYYTPSPSLFVYSFGQGGNSTFPFISLQSAGAINLFELRFGLRYSL